MQSRIYINISAIILIAAMTLPVFAAMELQYGSVDGAIENISPTGDIISLIDSSGKSYKIFITPTTLIMNQSRVVRLGQEDLTAFRAYVEFSQDSGGRIFGEWIDLRQSDADRENLSRSTILKSDAYNESLAPGQNSGNTQLDAGEDIMFEAATSLPQKGYDEQSNAFNQGKDLMGMSLEEYEKSVDDEAKRILQELGIE